MFSMPIEIGIDDAITIIRHDGASLFLIEASLKCSPELFVMNIDLN